MSNYKKAFIITMFFTSMVGTSVHAQQRSLHVTFPNEEGIVLVKGETYEITWDINSRANENVSVQIYKAPDFINNGGTIMWDRANTGSVLWTVPDVLADGCDYWIKVYITDDKDDCDWGNDAFRICSRKECKVHQIYESDTPKIDGILNDVIWAYVRPESLIYGGEKQAYHTKWTAYSDNLVTWKSVWCSESNRLYFGVHVEDDIKGLFDNGPASIHYIPSEDESLEIAIDANNSGGDYWKQYIDAQYWRVTGENNRDLAHYPSKGTHQYLENDFITAIRYFGEGNWDCEIELKLYNYMPSTEKILSIGDQIGFDMWYNDSDNKSQKDGYFQTDKQVGWWYTGEAWKNADAMGLLVLDNLIEGVSGVEYESVLLNEFALHQNYPNPFNPCTQINYQLPSAGHCELCVYNVRGEKIRTLVQGRQDAGVHDILWDGKNESGENVSSGMYFYRLQYGDKIHSRKMIFMQ